jgi:cell division protein FtsA
MKVQFGTAIAEEANNNAYITIPGLRGLPPKEISVKNLAHIIEARMHEILDYVVYHLKQINLDKKLYGGIILTGGGAQLKHITQLTEFVTGLGARIGYPNEHLAGGYTESLMNPMYSTCIGLILRGYHDFENGRLRFTGEGGNYMHITAEELAPILAEIAAPPEAMEEQAEDAHEAAQRKAGKRNEKVKRLFDGLKGKFMKIFEDMDDHEIN